MMKIILHTLIHLLSLSLYSSMYNAVTVPQKNIFVKIKNILRAICKSNMYKIYANQVNTTKPIVTDICTVYKRINRAK